MLVVDGEQGSNPLWPRAGAGKHVDCGVGEKLLAHLWRAPEDALWNLQPIERGLQDAAPIPLEDDQNAGPSSVVNVLGERWSQQNTGQRDDGRPTQRYGDREDVGQAWPRSPYRGSGMGNGNPERRPERVE